MYKLLEGKTYAVAEDNHNARIAYKEALNFDENCARAYLYIGDAYSVDGRLEDAIDWWKKLCEELSQKSYICYSRLESALFELGRFSAIAEIYLRILEKDEKNIRAIRSLARIQVKMGKIPEAINHLNDVLKIKPDDNAAAMELFNLYKQNNNVEGMMEVAENFCNIDYREEDLFTCSNCSHVLPEPEIICPKCRKVGTYDI